MTKPTDHHLVRSYLRQFDAAAAALPRTRRALLREEIITHLRDAISPDMSEAEVAAAIADLGSPAEIIGEETSSTPRRRGYSASGTDWLRILFIVVAVAAGALALVVMLPSAVYYLTAPGLYFSAFVWTLGGVLTAACAAFIVAARWRSKR
jgi:uncharacterized membrane protein